MVRFAAAVIAMVVTSFGLSASAANADIVLLDFWSPQCGPCMQMKPTMHALEQANYPIREIDTTRDSETSRRFGVTQIPCFVMLVDGQEVDRQIGFTSSERIQQMFEKAKDVVELRRRGRGQSIDQAVQPAVNRPTATGPAPQLDANAPNVARERDPWAQPAANTNPAPAQNLMQQPPATPDATAGDFPPSLIAATVRIRVEDTQGRSFGTGTIIDSRSGEALIVTCGHLFRESKGKGPMTVELFEMGTGGPQVVGEVSGQLISYDLERDVAFVSIRPNRQVSVAPVAPPRTAIRERDRVATIGCSNGKDPTLLPQRITHLDRYQGPANIEVTGAPEEGRSGGGLFNLQGQLIGVCYAADYEGREGLYAALESVHEELNRLNLRDVYAKPADSQLASQPTVIRGQEPASLPPITPLPGSTPPAGGNTKGGSLPNLSESEQAAFGEVMQRAASSEVMIIVRPKTPGGQSEVIQLDNVSPDFVRALQEARQRGVQSPSAK